MPVYWKRQCEHCKNRKNCPHRQASSEYINMLSNIDRNTPNVYGILQWWCDWFFCDEDTIKEERSCMAEVIG